MSCLNGCDRSGWCDTKFYCRYCVGRLGEFFRSYNPSDFLCGNDQFQWLTVVNPNLKTKYYRHRLNRQGKTSPETVLKVNKKLPYLSHSKLLDMAVKEGITKGYWMIFCEEDYILDWYWKVIVTTFYNYRHIEYTTICCALNDNCGGRIFIINDDFRNLSVVEKIGDVVREIAVRHEFDFDKMMFYKPSFYTDVGIYSRHTRRFLNPYIYFSFFDPCKSSFIFAYGVRYWFDN